MTLCTVLGGTGYIGSRLVQSLRLAGHEVQVPPRGTQDWLSRPLGHVFYCAGLTGDFRERPFATIEAHVSLLARVLEHGRFDSLLYLSSTRVYAGAQQTNEASVLCAQPHDPASLYNLSKLAAEALCLHGGRPGVRVARVSNVVGPDMDPASANLVATLWRDANAGHITLRSAPHSAKDYVHIDDVVQWLPQIALRGQYAVYNVARGVQVRHADWLAWMAAATGCSTDVLPDAPEQTFPPIDIRRIVQEFGVVPRPVHGWLVPATH